MTRERKSVFGGHKALALSLFLILPQGWAIDPPGPRDLMSVSALGSTARETTEFPDFPVDSLQRLSSRVREWIEEDRLVGAELLVMRDRQTILHQAFGWKDREAGEEMPLNTLFNIRSMTKPLVGTAIQLLVAEGTVALDDPVGRFLPAFESETTGDITVGQLLRHRSGLPVSIGWDPANPPSSLQAHTESIAEAGPQFDPGTRFWYSDAGADVLGALVEAASGESLEAYMESNLFKPLGMADTGFLSSSSKERLPMERVAALYGGATGGWQRFWQPTDDPFYPFPLGSQGVYSTPMDFARFLGMWLDLGLAGGEQFLPESGILSTLTPRSAMTQLGSTAPFPTGFPGQEVWHGEMAMLWRESGIASTSGSAYFPSVRAFGYAGSDGTFAWVWPEDDLMVLFFTQSRGQDIHLELEGLLFDLFFPREGSARSTTTPSSASPLPAPEPTPEAFLPFLGRYQAEFGSHQGSDFTVLFHEGALALDIPGQTTFTLNGPDEAGWRTFSLTDHVAVRFQEDPSGRVAALEMAQTSVFARIADLEEKPAGVPDDLAYLLGDYLIPGGQGILKVFWTDGTLIFWDPSGRATPMSRAEAMGVWLTDETPSKAISFPTDPQGRVMAMTLKETVVLPRIEGEGPPSGE